jgi:hypothetical protein
MINSTRYITFAGAALCAAVLAALAPSLSAQSQRARERAAARSRVAATAGEVLLNEKVVMRLRSKAGSLTPAQRADRVARRLDELSGAGKLQAAELQVRNVPAGAALYAGRELIATADHQEAKASGLPPRRLAESWRYNM